MLMPHVKFLLCYCLTETGCIAASKIEKYNASLEKPDSVGRLSINSKIRIVDLESKENLGPDKFGELYYSGDGLMLGYFKDNEKTLASVENGFFKTGDMAMYDEDGWIYLKGRIEDLIKIENYLFCPIELEDVILAHPYVKDVVVIGNNKDVLACYPYSLPL
ncbi:hypothetical protein NQ314_000848 [Rhamnusium bicolor]|uniref:AMP-dependent synthetase/ligase domain-containing protein n=1 Tax=Rhamnusium bicolor TaxID=1586634 RepID=A0AAV8ZTL1_9CUCU|nr:hypothetical protein NQ314_000848 [Rhamnusium bicolor]